MRGRLFSILFCLLLLSCGEVQVRRFVDNGVPLHQGQKLDLVFKDPNLNFKDYEGVIIKKTIAEAPTTHVVPSESVAEVISSALYEEINRAGVFKDVKKEGEEVSSRYLVLETSLTELNPGSGAARYLIGFGAGATNIQVEGRIVDPTTNKTLFTYIDRRDGWIGVFGGRSRSLILDDAIAHAKDVVEELKSLTP